MAFPTSLSDSSWLDHAVAASKSRAFSIATAAWLTRPDDLLVLLVEVLSAGLLGQIEVPVGDAAHVDRDAEKRAHRRMVGRKADRPLVLAEIVEPQRRRLLDEHAQDSLAPRQLSDRGLGGWIDPGRQETFEPGAASIDHAESRVASAGQRRSSFYQLL